MIRSPCTSALSMSLFTLPSGLVSSVKFISNTLLSSRLLIKKLNILESSINPSQALKYILADNYLMKCWQDSSMIWKGGVYRQRFLH